MKKGWGHFDIHLVLSKKNHEDKKLFKAKHILGEVEVFELQV